MTYKTASVYPHPQALFLWSYLLLLTLSLLLQRQWLPWKHRIDILHAGSFYLLFSLPRTFFPLDNLTACFLIPFGSFPECRWGGPSLASLFKNTHACACTDTRTRILSPPFLFHLTPSHLLSPDCNILYFLICCSREDRNSYTCCCAPDDWNSVWHKQYMLNK